MGENGATFVVQDALQDPVKGNKENEDRKRERTIVLETLIE